MEAKDKYSQLLPRHAEESKRLNKQHKFLVRNTGFLIHPLIKDKLPVENAQIADIATGTGIWLTDLASGLPKSTNLHGFDISAVQFPTLDTQASKIQFTVLDATSASVLESPYVGQFDLVHIRFLSAALESEIDWEAVARNAFALLKPGGWVEWQELDFAQAFVALRDDPGQRTPAYQELLNVVRPSLDYMCWSTGRLELMLERVGFVNVLDEATSSDRLAETRLTFTVMSVGVLKGVFAKLKQAEGMTEEDVGRRLKMVDEEIAAGAYMRCDFHIYLGQKPASS